MNFSNKKKYYYLDKFQQTFHKWYTKNKLDIKRCGISVTEITLNSSHNL